MHIRDYGNCCVSCQVALGKSDGLIESLPHEECNASLILMRQKKSDVLVIQQGAHLKAVRWDNSLISYEHHGIAISEDMVIHFAFDEDKGRIAIKFDPIEGFIKDSKDVEIVKHETPAFTPDEIVIRAVEALDSDEHYNVIQNNCEHFANWCVTGNKRSRQIESLCDGSLIFERLAKKFKTAE